MNQILDMQHLGYETTCQLTFRNPKVTAARALNTHFHFVLDSTWQWGPRLRRAQHVVDQLLAQVDVRFRAQLAAGCGRLVEPVVEYAPARPHRRLAARSGGTMQLLFGGCVQVSPRGAQSSGPCHVYQPTHLWSCVHAMEENFTWFRTSGKSVVSPVSCAAMLHPDHVAIDSNKIDMPLSPCTANDICNTSNCPLAILKVQR